PSCPQVSGGFAPPLPRVMPIPTPVDRADAVRPSSLWARGCADRTVGALRRRLAGSVPRRAFLIGLGAGVGAIGLGARSGGRAAAAPRRPARGPNVLYVTADDLGTRLGAYGHPLVSSPHVDAFAEHALLFERAYCQVAICGASRTTIL